LITATKSKETRDNILAYDIFNSLIPTFGYLQRINMIKECLLKVGIKLLKILYARILSLVSLLFVAVINPYLIFLNFQFLNIQFVYFL